MSPTLEVLPLNSTLSDVTIPRYDENNRRVAYLKAGLMEILPDGPPVNDRQAIMVDCSDIQLRMNTEAAGGHVAVDMEQARYRLTPGVLTVQERITASSPQFDLAGTGGVFHLDTRRGFLFGPISCQIYAKPEPSASLMKPPLPALPALPALLASTSFLVAAEPTHRPPTAAELLKVEQLATSTEAQLQSSQTEAHKESAQHEEKAQDAQDKLLSFSQQVDNQALTRLIQNPPPANTTAQAKAPIKDPELTIECDGGCFFDGNENLLVLLRNVVVKEERFTLKAKKELKVFFLTEEPAEGASEEEADDNPDLTITDLESLVATGGVNFSGIDKDGNPVEASAATAYYDDQSKVLILKDGRPTFWMKKGKMEIQLQSENQGSSVRIELGEEGLKANTSGDGWKIDSKDFPLKNN
ncbi:hypothetical protein [Roseibacillus ishigakijimensis]|uniref:Organic solvent tolerance-like N-terminal domain-containing protein n=1 Tax=Roseibacillus ishigakijimensis TaxID=454146 RepID=A0A934VMM5_9BACT|nr:hypothetical protein [Roseibacillus ishigakijimensis]